MNPHAASVRREEDSSWHQRFAELEHLYQTAPVGLCLMDSDLRFVRINKRLADINGHPIDAHIGRTLAEILPDIAPTIEPLYRRVLETGEPILDLEVTGKTAADPDRTICCLVSYHPLKGADGEVWGVSTVVQDITKRKRAEDILLHSEAQLRSMADSFPIFISFVDTDLRYQFNNAQYQKVFGRSPDDLKGQYIRDVLGREGFESIRPHVEAALSGRPVCFAAEMVLPNGRAIHVRTNFLPRRDSADRVTGFYALVADETERHQAERALKVSEERYRTLVENAPDAIVVLDLETGRFVDCNRNAMELFGLPRERLLQVGPVELSPPVQPDGRSSEEKARAEIARAYEGGQTTFEWIHRHADGHEISCEIRLVRFPHPDRKLIRGSITDITDRKRAEAEKRCEEDHLRLLLETTHVIPWEADPVNWRFTYVGPQAKRLLGYPVGQWLEKDFWVDHIHPDDRDEAIDFCHRSMRERRDYQFEYRMIDAKGQIVWIHDIVHAGSPGDTPDHLRGFLIDITDRKRSEILQKGQKQVLEMLARGESLPAVLEVLARSTDGLQTGMRCSILLLDKDGKRLWLGAGPGLPGEYNRAIDGLEIGPEVGSCGTAAFLRKLVVAEDTETDPRWKDFRHLARRFGLRACWSQPILSQEGNVLGTLAMYHDRPYRPSSWDLGVVEQAANLAEVAIEQRRATIALEENEAKLRNSHRSLQDLAGRLLHAQEDERRRLARELHDDFTQRLAALAIEIGKLEGMEGIEPHDAIRSLGDMRRKIVRLSEDVHRISRRLHPSILEDLGLVDAIASECHGFLERSGIAVEFLPADVPRTIPIETALSIYRVVQEGLQNIAKHSEAKTARISLRGDNGSLRLSIGDTGIGIRSDQRRGHPGMGLASMRERVRLVQGTMSIRSVPGKGTVIKVRVPLRGASA